MPPLKLFLSLLIVLFCHEVHAGFRVSAGLGMGSTSTSNEYARSEGPFVQSYSFESLVNSRFLVGAEHLRSLKLSPISTGISFTGVFARYYLNAAPVSYLEPDAVDPQTLMLHDISYFIGAGLGFAQASLPTNDDGLSANAAGIYISPRAGTEIQVSKRIGIRGELLMGMTLIGKGNIGTFSLLGSVYYGF